LSDHSPDDARAALRSAARRRSAGDGRNDTVAIDPADDLVFAVGDQVAAVWKRGHLFRGL
jgi:hypothetical protein